VWPCWRNMLRTSRALFRVWVDSPSGVAARLPDLLCERFIAADFEGVHWGRWGEICLAQIATPSNVFIFDTLVPGVLKALAPVLESRVPVKVIHDCREDASALANAGVKLSGVYDTQAAHSLLLVRDCQSPYQIALDELLIKTVGTANRHSKQVDRWIRSDPRLWRYRPLSEPLLDYATQDVQALLDVRAKMCSILRDPTMRHVLQVSDRFLQYASMNMHLTSTKSLFQKGLRVEAMLATVTPTAMYFKLNCGLVAVACSKIAMESLKSTQVGEIVPCLVTDWDEDQEIVYIQKLAALGGNRLSSTKPVFPGMARTPEK